jgi:hypothetical protein
LFKLDLAAAYSNGKGTLGIVGVGFLVIQLIEIKNK